MHRHNLDFIISQKKIEVADEKEEKQILEEETSNSRFMDQKSERMQFNVKPLYDALEQPLDDDQ